MGARRRRNKFPRLRGRNGDWITTEGGIPEEVKQHIGDAFIVEHTEGGEGLLECCPTQITTEIRMDLNKEISDEEARVAIFQLGGSRVSDPNGLSGMFNQKN